MAVADSKRPLRILMTADAVGGVWTYALELARALEEHNVEIVLVTMGPLPGPHQVAAASRCKNLTLLSRDSRLEWMPEPWDDVDKTGEWLLELERELGADLIHINGYAHAALPFLAPVVLVTHSCVCSWWRAVHGVEAPASWNEYRHRVSEGLRSADLVVAPTAAIFRDIALSYEGPKSGRLIRNGRRVESAPRAKEEIILSVGRLWDEAKNLEQLDRCAPRLSWPVYVAGALEQGDREGAQPRSVRALGFLSEHEVTEWMSRAAIYCLPARYEPFGLSILEAAQSGCALVVGDIAPLREVWGDAATYVAPDDDAALIAALEKLSADSEHRRHLAWLARRRAARFFPEPMAVRYRALYDELTCGPRYQPGPPPIERILAT